MAATSNPSCFAVFVKSSKPTTVDEGLTDLVLAVLAAMANTAERTCQCSLSVYVSAERSKADDPNSDTTTGQAIRDKTSWGLNREQYMGCLS